MNILRYDWIELRKQSKDNIHTILAYFMNMHLLKGEEFSFLLHNEWAKKVYNSKEKNSYILNLEDFIKNELKATRDEQFVYLDLLSIRDVFTYFNTKGKAIYIPIWKIEKKYDVNKLKANRLLDIDDNNIHFVYEEEL